jgi:hypothetical protein
MSGYIPMRSGEVARTSLCPELHCRAVAQLQHRADARLITIILLFRRALVATIRVRLPLVHRLLWVNDRVQEALMRKQLLAGAMAVALATGMTTSAMAFDRGGAGGFGGYHDGSFAATHGSRFAGVRGFSGYRHGSGGQRFVGSHSGLGYGPSYGGAYYEGVAPFGRLVGRPATGGSTFFVGM